MNHIPKVYYRSLPLHWHGHISEYDVGEWITREQEKLNATFIELVGGNQIAGALFREIQGPSYD